MKICQLVRNPYSRDTRLIKQSAALRSMGFEVVCVGTLQRGFREKENLRGVAVLRCSGKPRAILQVCRPVLRRMAWLIRPLRVARRILGRLRRALGGGRPAPKIDPLEEWLRTESRFSDTEHLKFWSTLFGAVLFFPLLLILPLLWACLRLVARTVVWAYSRLVARPVIWAYRAVSRTCQKKISKAGTLLRGIHMVVVGVAQRADVYQANDFDTLAMGWLCARLNNAILVYDSHELFDESFPRRKKFFQRYLIRRIEGRLSRKAFSVITVCDSIARILKRRYGYGKLPTVVRNSQVYVENFVPDTYLEDRIGPKDGRLVCVYAGRITSGRGLPAVIEALDHCSEEVVLVLMGDVDGVFRPKLERLKKLYRKKPNLHILNPVPSDRLLGVISSADVGLMLTETACLSYYYGLGNKMFHYMNAGLAVLTADQPEKRAVVERYGNGTYLPELTPQQIGRTLEELRQDPGRLRRMKQNGRASGRELSWEVEAKKYMAVYEDITRYVMLEEDVYAPTPSTVARVWGIGGGMLDLLGSRLACR